jgi:hypothetical protein
MATKADTFKAQQQRDANPPKPKSPPRKRRDSPVDTSRPGVSATDRKAGGGSSGGRNKSARAARKGGARLEDSATGKPSRKSTRKSVGRVKRTTELRRKALQKGSRSKVRRG